MEKIGRLSVLKEAEVKLRDAAANPAETGPEVWRLEGRIEVSSEEEMAAAEYTPQAPPKFKVDDVVKEVENAYGRSIVPEPNISCVEKGGLLERIEPEPAPSAQGNDVGAEGDIVMDHTNSHLLDQFGTPPTSQEASTAAGGDVSAAARTGVSGDVEMGGTASNEPTQTNTAEGETGDWVMVGNEGNATKAAGANTGGSTPGSGLTPGQVSTGLETSNFDDATNFTNMDSAGDALAAYGEQHDLDLPDLDNSAFGDAFHASDNEGGHHHPEEDEMS